MSVAVSASGAKSSVSPPPPPSPLTLNFFWQGAVPVNVSGASGTTSGTDRFVHATSGGILPYGGAGPSITYNPSGKLNIFALGNAIGVSWNGMSINEVEAITVQYDMNDAGGYSRTGSDTCVIKRTS